MRQTGQMMLLLVKNIQSSLNLHYARLLCNKKKMKKDEIKGGRSCTIVVFFQCRTPLSRFINNHSINPGVILMFLSIFLWSLFECEANTETKFAHGLLCNSYISSSYFEPPLYSIYPRNLMMRWMCLNNEQIWHQLKPKPLFKVIKCVKCLVHDRCIFLSRNLQEA